MLGEYIYARHGCSTRFALRLADTVHGPAAFNVNQFGFWVNVRPLQSKGLTDSQAGDRNQQDKCALGLLEPAPHAVSFLRADDLWLVLGRGNALHRSEEHTSELQSLPTRRSSDLPQPTRQVCSRVA